MFRLAINGLQGKLGMSLWRHTLPSETNDIAILLYYVGEKALTLEDFERHNTNVPSRLIATLGSELTILSLHSNDKGEGFGMYLISAVCREAYESGVTRVVLDDMTDRRGKKNNIYVRLGLTYIDPDYPEMEGDTREIGKGWERVVPRRT